jgi:predicted  nucleic acid-binding Zn-ribbon protein
MRFKVNNKYVVDAKSHDDAIRVIKMFDAMETYSIRWIDTYAKSQGYGPDFWRYDTEIKANNVKEALEKLAKQVALGGTGTANCLVMHVSNSHATYQFTGRLSELLKKTKEQLGDSVKDAESEADVNLDFLIKDELEAIDGYRKMIAKTSNPQLLSVLSHILDEETEHVEELRAAQAGVYEVDVDDSIHDYRKVRYKGATLIEDKEGIWMIEGFGETYASLDKAKKGVEEWISQGIHF